MAPVVLSLFRLMTHNVIQIIIIFYIWTNKFILVHQMWRMKSLGNGFVWASAYLSKGPSINDVTALGERGYQGFCDNSNRATLIKSVTMGGGGVKNYQKLRDVIYGRPPR